MCLCVKIQSFLFFFFFLSFRVSFFFYVRIREATPCSAEKRDFSFVVVTLSSLPIFSFWSFVSLSLFSLVWNCFFFYCESSVLARYHWL